MKRLIRLLLIPALMSVCHVQAVDLKKDLDPDTYAKSGLEKLSEAELAVLNAAIGQLMGEQEAGIRAETEIPQGEDGFGLETVRKRVQSLFQSNAPDVITSSIKGDFKGWRGNTRFHLENGQVWRQTEADTFFVNVKDPEVTIRRGALGSYLLKIEGYNSSVKVERVE